MAFGEGSAGTGFEIGFSSINQNVNIVKVLHILPLSQCQTQLSAFAKATAGQPSTAAVHPFFRLINPPAVRGMACQDVKKSRQFF